MDWEVKMMVTGWVNVVGNKKLEGWVRGELRRIGRNVKGRRLVGWGRGWVGVWNRVMGRSIIKCKIISNISLISIVNNSPYFTNSLKHTMTSSPKHPPYPNRPQTNQLLITLSHNPNNYHPTPQQHLNYSHPNPSPHPPPSKPQSSPFSTRYHLTQKSARRPSSPPMMTFSEDQTMGSNWIGKMALNGRSS